MGSSAKYSSVLLIDVHSTDQCHKEIISAIYRVMEKPSRNLGKMISLCLLPNGWHCIVCHATPKTNTCFVISSRQIKNIIHNSCNHDFIIFKHRNLNQLVNILYFQLWYQVDERRKNERSGFCDFSQWGWC